MAVLKKKGEAWVRGFAIGLGSKGCFFMWYGLTFFLSKIMGHVMFRLWVIWWIKFYLMSFGFRGLFFFLFFSCFILAEMFKAYDFFWNICDDLLSLFVITVMLMFRSNKKMFSCVLHTANTLTCFERSFFIKKYWKFRKCVFAWIS